MFIILPRQIVVAKTNPSRDCPLHSQHKTMVDFLVNVDQVDGHLEYPDLKPISTNSFNAINIPPINALMVSFLQVSFILFFCQWNSNLNILISVIASGLSLLVAAILSFKIQGESLWEAKCRTLLYKYMFVFTLSLFSSVLIYRGLF